MSKQICTNLAGIV